MGRNKKKRRAKLKNRRNRRKLLGKPVYFSLSNHSKKLPGANYRYYYKPNLHNVVFKGADFNNCRFKSGHITETNMNETEFCGCDFIGVNLRGTQFKKATFTNCFFFQCNLSDCDFSHSIFNNVYMASSNIMDANNLSLSDINVLKESPQIVVPSYLEYKIKYIDKFSKIKKFGVLTTQKKKLNKWVLKILIDEFSERNISLLLTKIAKRSRAKQKRYITVNNFREELLHIKS